MEASEAARPFLATIIRAQIACEHRVHPYLTPVHRLPPRPFTQEITGFESAWGYSWRLPALCV